MKLQKNSIMLSEYQQHQQHLLFTVIKTTNIVFIIGIAVNSLWFPIVFWKTLIQNNAALLVVLIGWWCLWSARRGFLRRAVRMYLASSITLMVLILLNVGQNFILNVVLILTVLMLLSVFLESPRLAHLWGGLSAALYVTALTVRIFGPFEDLAFGPYDLVGLYAFPVLNFIAIVLIGRGAAVRLSDALTKSEDARKGLERSSQSLKEAHSALNVTNKQLQSELNERVCMEGTLQKVHHELEQRVQERTADLENMNNALKKEVTDRRTAEEALRKSEKEKAAILNSIDELVVLQDKEYKILWANKAAGESAGMIPEQLVGCHCYEIWAQRSDPCPDCPIAIAIETGHAQEIEKYTPDGKAWSVRGYPIRDIQGNITEVVEATLEITERKRAEEALKESGRRLRFLSSQLITAQEKERRRISIELHDELGQALMVLKLQLRSMGKQLKEDQTTLREECEQILHYIDDVTENVRRLSRDLSPSILEDLGLLPALRWLIDEFTKHHHPIQSKLDIEDTPDLFSKEDEIIIFRIFQEALTNIGKHAQATHVSIIIKLQDGGVSLVVEDNGKGFDLEQVSSREATEKGMGLATMEERVRMVGGSLDIWSKKETGTRITFSIPIN